MDLVLVPVHLGMHWCLAVRSHFTFSPPAPGIKTGGGDGHPDPEIKEGGRSQKNFLL